MRLAERFLPVATAASPAAARTGPARLPAAGRRRGRKPDPGDRSPKISSRPERRAPLPSNEDFAGRARHRLAAAQGAGKAVRCAAL
jgi:hypothetical protein